MVANEDTLDGDEALLDPANRGVIQATATPGQTALAALDAGKVIDVISLHFGAA